MGQIQSTGSQLTIAATQLKSQLGSFYALINLQFTCLSIDPNVSRGGLNNLDQHIFIFVSYLPMLFSFCDKKQFALLTSAVETCFTFLLNPNSLKYSHKIWIV